MKFETLLDSLPATYSLVDREMITRAYKFAEKAHERQKRASGEPYITHCVSVASILVEMSVPPALVIAGLLHDTVEDTEVTLEQLRNEFGEEVAQLVDGVTKLINLPRVSRINERMDKIDDIEVINPDDSLPGEKGVSTKTKTKKQEAFIENLIKMITASDRNIGVIIIKLADRLHNMRTLSYIAEPKRSRIAKETMDIFAPLANRFGIWQMKWELEDLGFRYMNPDKYKEISESLAERRTVREKQIDGVIERLIKILNGSSIKAEISGRPKHIYSIYKKMVEKGRPFEMVRDVRAVRLIVPDVPSCYAALGVIHTNWRPIPHEFDDYIAAPKDNFYQSLHTAVIYDDGKPLEVQIRTNEMHQSAEYGIAAHWKYKEGGKLNYTYEQRVNWFRQMLEWKKDVIDPQEFLEGMKTDVFQDRVYVFTPRGDIIDLPAGSTPIDFAYHVHTEIGHRCRGAKANGKLVTLDYKLKTSEMVEILTAKQGGPSRDWLNANLGLVHTQRARSKIKQWFKKLDFEQNAAQGKQMLDKELRRLGMDDADIDQLAHDFEFDEMEEFYSALGCGDISLGKIINRISESEVDATPTLPEIRPSTDRIDRSDSVMVLGIKGLLTSMARCCNPVPGDEIVGYITRGRGATVHRKDCPNILRLTDQSRIVKVDWGEPKRTYPVTIKIKAYDRQGLMNDITSVLNNESINLADLDLNVNQNIAVIHLVLEVGDIVQLSRALTKIDNLQNIIEVSRLRPG